MKDANETVLLGQAAAYLRERGVHEAALGMVLGSGLKNFGDRVQDKVEISFAEVPGWPTPKVEGHGGSLVLGTVEGLKVACLTGRVHLYEGWSPNEVTRAVRTLRHLGIENFVLTNAAGGIDTSFTAGDLMLIEDHLNLTSMTPLLGLHEAALGPRFPDQSEVYDLDLRTKALAIDDALQTGVYVGLLGPSYETPAEVRMLGVLGGSAVGMSTVHEAMALNAMGAKVLGISLISNLAAGISAGALSHDEVIEAGAQAEGRLTHLLESLCRRLVA